LERDIRRGGAFFLYWNSNAFALILQIRRNLGGFIVFHRTDSKKEFDFILSYGYQKGFL
jgi:hypothetical protein